MPHLMQANQGEEWQSVLEEKCVVWDTAWFSYNEPCPTLAEVAEMAQKEFPGIPFEDLHVHDRGYGEDICLMKKGEHDFPTLAKLVESAKNDFSETVFADIEVVPASGFTLGIALKSQGKEVFHEMRFCEREVSVMPFDEILKLLKKPSGG